MTNKAALIILDGWGIGPIAESSAIAQAHTPYMDGLLKLYPNSTLVTFGEEVGLPAGQMGNSEVGHLNIGAGRIVYQELARINNAITSGTLSNNEVLKEGLRKAKDSGQKVHLMGLLSDGGVHSHISHLLALVDILEAAGCPGYIHAFLDGRDTAPNSGVSYLNTLVKHLEQKAINLGTVVGRYYAMDRDNRWERIKKAYDLMTNLAGQVTTNVIETVSEYYHKDVTDEFMEPLVCDSSSAIESGDLVICFNFRTDRPRQITAALTQRDIPDFDMKKLDLDFITMTNYDQSFNNISILFEKENIGNTLGEVIAKNQLSQFRIAETEKYPHVTYFLSGGREAPFEREERLVIPSPKVATYDLQPEMSAKVVTESTIAKIDLDQPDFICLNYANTDMVGHTGDFEAGKIAAETVDKCLNELIPVLQKYQYQIIIIADHGNADYMINEDGSPHTAHTTNPVPCILISSVANSLKDGKLADIAPTICMLMGIEIPSDMTGNLLIKTV